MSSTSSTRRHLTTSAVLGALLLAPLTVAPPASSAASLGRPTNLTPSGDISTNTPTLSWSRPKGAVKFEVEVDNDDDFSSPGFTSSTTNTSAVPTSLLSSGEQNWRVRAVSGSGATSGWSVSGFTIGAVTAPTPLSPVDGALLEQPDEPPLLQWTPTQGAVEYTVEVDDEEQFIDPRTYKTSTTALVVPDPLPPSSENATVYYWRVKAKKANGVESQFIDDSASFEVGPLAEVSVDGSDGDEMEDVVLDWQPVDGAQYYQLRVATDHDFNNVIDNQAKILGTRYSPPTTYKNNQYYWQVRAVDLSGNPTAWSTENANFDRVWQGSDDVPDTVYPSSPGEDPDPTPMRVADPMYFQWTPAQHATQYELQVGSDKNFSPDTYETCQIIGTTYTPYSFPASEVSGFSAPRTNERCVPIAGAVNYWRVRPLDRSAAGSAPTVLGIFSPTESFIYDSNIFSSVSPANGATVDVPTLSWSPVRDAETYRIDIKNNFGQTVKSGVRTYATSYTPVNTSALDPAKGPYTWTLTAYGASGAAVTPARQSTFDVSGNVPASGAAPLTPLSGTASDASTLRAPKLTWAPQSGADNYRILVGPAGTNTWYSPVSQDALSKKLPYPAVTDTWKWFLSSGSYDWRVQAYDKSGALIGTGPIATFTIDPLDTVQGQRIAIDGTALDSAQGCAAKIGDDTCDDIPTTPIFDWQPVKGASAYILYISEDSSFTNHVEPLTALAATGSTRWTPTLSALRSALPDSQAGGSYYWFVRPCKADGVCAPSPVSATGKATNTFRKLSPKLVLAEPANRAMVRDTDVTFTWADYLTTNQDFTWSDSGEVSNQSAMAYRIQVNDTEVFSNTASRNLDDAIVDQATYTAFSKLYPEGTLYWRVQAIDGEGNGLSWSETRSFDKQSRAVTLKPGQDDEDPTTAPFRWKAQPFVGSYQVEVSQNNDPQFSSTNRLFPIKTVKQNAYAWNLPIPRSPQAYHWRVRRVDADGNPGPWSAASSFYSQGAPPVLKSPSPGVLAPANGPVFSWQEVSGATSYALEIRRDGSNYNWKTVNTAATAWATTTAVPDGVYRWRVVAKDAGKATIGVSAWRSFKVDGSRPTVKTTSPSYSATPKSNIKVTFSEAVRGVSNKTFFMVRKGSPKHIRGKLTMSRSGLSAKFNPTAKLKRGKTYTVKVTSGIKDGNHNTLVAKTWQFKVR